MKDTATSAANGQVLVAGGLPAPAELYDLATEMWTATGFMTTARRHHTATLLPNGLVLVAGGDGEARFASAELYDPATGVWTATGSMAFAHVEHTATLLLNRLVLVAGGHTGNTNYTIRRPEAGRLLPALALGAGFTRRRCCRRQVLVSGGNAGNGILARAELYKSAPKRLDIP